MRPVVRITPDEIHLSDPENYEKIYYIGTKYWKSPTFYNGFGIGYSTFSTLRNDVHAVRRAALNPMFSRRMVLNLEGLVQEKAEKLVNRAQHAFAEKKPLDIHHGFRAISVDVISDYAFNRCYNLLDRPDFGVEFFQRVSELGHVMWFFQQWPWVQPVAFLTPKWMASIVSKPLEQLMNMQEDCVRQIIAVTKQMEAGEYKEGGRTTIFHQLLDPGVTEGHVVPTVNQLKDEAYSLLGAAADTTGNALTVGAFRVVTDKAIYRKVVAELTEAFPDENTRLDFMTLEKLPYLVSLFPPILSQYADPSRPVSSKKH
ncbi:hypothetical protein FGG08_006201 [Glutinoglossum americanum]|uniref:Cytochrome P450 n=1 Tax=Glutinoglossum americanum TaxID=1670608 RepID=A0A9P8I1R1_9PEZI|nr:hypothetical protein FGG08_006201 [Glutinoglossum americanum]